MGALCAGAPAEGAGKGALAAAFVRAAAARPRGGRLACSSRWAPVTQLHSERRRCAGGSRPRSVVVLSFSPYVFHPPFPPPPLSPRTCGAESGPRLERGDGWLPNPRGRGWGGERGSVAGPRAGTERQK